MYCIVSNILHNTIAREREIFLRERRKCSINVVQLQVSVFYVHALCYVQLSPLSHQNLCRYGKTAQIFIMYQLQVVVVNGYISKDGEKRISRRSDRRRRQWSDNNGRCGLACSQNPYPPNRTGRKQNLAKGRSKMPTGVEREKGRVGETERERRIV